MELLVHPKPEYLLDASLESLHAESTDWLNEIDFWRDEMAFFYKLLHRKETRDAFPSETLAAMEKELVSITGDKLDQLRDHVIRHERSLADLLRTTSLLQEEGYRETHRWLHRDMSALNVMIRAFKKNVYSFAANSDF